MVRQLAFLLIATLVTACGADRGPAAADPDTEIFAGLPECDRVGIDDLPEVPADVPGLVLPADAWVTQVQEHGPLTLVDAAVRMNPLEVRAYYESRSDLDLLDIEDEIFETEVLLRAEGRRMYLIAAVVCADGTELSATIGPDTDESGLPEFRSRDH